MTTEEAAVLFAGMPPEAQDELLELMRDMIEAPNHHF